MDQTCACGMTVDHPTTWPGCPECGTQICRSCGMQLDATTYCRWCATTLGLSRVA